jgi:ribosomal protein S18 acetylase RimI-like enzyme
MMIIKSLKNSSLEEIYSAFEAAFSDYEITLSKDELQRMLIRRGFVPELSFGAFDNGQLISFTFNGIGTFNGEMTAYDTGTGTVKEYRGQGLASRIFLESIPELRKAGVRNYLLEVLQHNTSAVSVYTKLGFKATREFNYFSLNMSEITWLNKALPGQYSIRSISPDFVSRMELFQDFVPSWQNSFEAISRNPDDFIAKGVFHGQELVGYGILEPTSGDITQLAVSVNSRRQGIGSVILKELSVHNQHVNLKLVNSEVSCRSITQFLEAHNMRPKGRQFEMIKRLG